MLRLGLNRQKGVAQTVSNFLKIDSSTAKVCGSFRQLLQKYLYEKQNVILPVLNSIETLLVRDVIHQYETHGASIVGCSDGTVTFLTGCVLEMISKPV